MSSNAIKVGQPVARLPPHKPGVRNYRTGLTTARYTHLTDTTNQQADQLINALMDGFAMDWRSVK